MSLKDKIKEINSKFCVYKHEPNEFIPEPIVSFFKELYPDSTIPLLGFRDVYLYSENKEELINIINKYEHDLQFKDKFKSLINE